LARPKHEPVEITGCAQACNDKLLFHKGFAQPAAGKSPRKGREAVTFSCGNPSWWRAPRRRATGINMSFIKSRESRDNAEQEKVAEAQVEGEIREFVRRDVSTLRRSPESESELVANNIGTLLQRVAGTSVQEIDRLISELKMLREMLQNESQRVQREIVEYATLSQAAMQSTKIITESLTHWKKVPDAPSVRPE